MANKVIRYFMPFLAVGAFLGLVLLPDRITWPLTLFSVFFSFFVIGLWAVFFRRTSSPGSGQLTANLTRPILLCGGSPD